jgi:mRNA interferase YafQ
MHSVKKTADRKRAAPPRTSDHTKQFLKDWQRLSHSGRYDMQRLKAVMMLLIANDEPLGAEWLDHALKGDWADHRECHVGGDFLLIYQVDAVSVSFVRTGSHADLFESLLSPNLFHPMMQPVPAMSAVSNPATD